MEPYALTKSERELIDGLTAKALEAQHQAQGALRMLVATHALDSAINWNYQNGQLIPANKGA